MLVDPNCGRPVTQIVAAENFLRARPGQVAFVTIDIGGNDAGGCITAAGVNEVCSANAIAAIRANLATILARLKAVTPGVKVRGMSYPTPQLMLTGPLPPGVAYRANGTGAPALTGTPTTAGTFRFWVTASNGVAPNDVQRLTLTITP
jgi:hypothetical protein